MQSSELRQRDKENLGKPVKDGTIVFDAYAWVEYAADGPKAEFVNNYLNSPDEILTPASVIGELKESMLRHGEKKKTISQVIDFIRARSTVVKIDLEIAELAGEVNFQQKKVKGWGMLDSIVYAVLASPEWKNSKVLTGDPHFKGLTNVVYIGE